MKFPVIFIELNKTKRTHILHEIENVWKSALQDVLKNSKALMRR